MDKATPTVSPAYNIVPLEDVDIQRRRRACLATEDKWYPTYNRFIYPATFVYSAQAVEGLTAVRISFAKISSGDSQ